MSKKRKHRKLLLRDGLFSTLLSLLVCYLFSLLFFNTSFFDPLSKALQDFSFLDVYYAERLNEQELTDTKVILVNVEHKTRQELANALDKVIESRAKAIGFDVILREFEKTAADTLLAKLLKEDRVIATYIIGDDGEEIKSHTFFGENLTSGFANFSFDSSSSVIREFSGRYESKQDIKESLPVVLARQYLSPKEWSAREIDEKIAKPRVINYQGGLDHYLHLNIDDILYLENTDLLNDKIILFGYLGSPSGNSFDIEDKHFTPLNTTTAGKSIPDMYGATIHANIISMLISDRFMYKVPRLLELTLLFLFSFVASVYFIWLDRRLNISYRTVRKTVLFVFSILLVWITLLLFKRGIVFKSATIIAVAVFSAGFVKYYKHLVRYINTKRKFKSYLN
ncbi:CHASE2 domain-containing protein [Maribacter sp.]